MDDLFAPAARQAARQLDNALDDAHKALTEAGLALDGDRPPRWWNQLGRIVDRLTEQAATLERAIEDRRIALRVINRARRRLERIDATHSRAVMWATILDVADELAVNLDNLTAETRIVDEPVRNEKPPLRQPRPQPPAWTAPPPPKPAPEPDDTIPDQGEPPDIRPEPPAPPQPVEDIEEPSGG